MTINRYEDLKVFNHTAITILDRIEQTMQYISQIIFQTVQDHKNGLEWTKHSRYRIWFDKWADFVNSLTPDNRSLSPPNRNSGILFSKSTFTKFKKYDEFSEGAFSRLDNIYMATRPVLINIKQFLAFYPELISTFANTFLYRVIDLKDSNGKERKITIINQKLPADIKLAYENLIKVDTINIIYRTLVDVLEANNYKFSKHVIGFMPGKSYLEHVNPHIGNESLLTCDINKFYNCLNLKNILDNRIFSTIMSLVFFNKYGISDADIVSDQAQRYVKFVNQTCSDMFNALMFFFTCNGMLTTGGFASPAISNILMIPFDIEMSKYVDHKLLTYTRYVDDICLSSPTEKSISGRYVLTIKNAEDIENMLNKYGLYLKYKKTRIFGKNDNKIITNLNLPKNPNESPSIGTKYKLELKKQFEGRKYSDLSEEEIGKLTWVKTINNKQYEFIKSGILEWPEDKPIFLSSTLTGRRTYSHINLIQQYLCRNNPLSNKDSVRFKYFGQSSLKAGNIINIPINNISYDLKVSSVIENRNNRGNIISIVKIQKLSADPILLDDITF